MRSRFPTPRVYHAIEEYAGQQVYVTPDGTFLTFADRARSEVGHRAETLPALRAQLREDAAVAVPAMLDARLSSFGSGSVRRLERVVVYGVGHGGRLMYQDASGARRAARASQPAFAADPGREEDLRALVASLALLERDLAELEAGWPRVTAATVLAARAQSRVEAVEVAASGLTPGGSCRLPPGTPGSDRGVKPVAPRADGLLRDEGGGALDYDERRP